MAMPAEYFTLRLILIFFAHFHIQNQLLELPLTSQKITFTNFKIYPTQTVYFNKKMMQTKKLFLLDGMALAYRAFYALNKNPRINSKGLNTSAILGFANTLYEVLKKEQPTHIAVAFDTSVPTFRHKEFAPYKAKRDAMPDDLSISLSYIKHFINILNIPILTADGFEADDIIGTLAKKAEQNGFVTYMMSSDKDFGQLISENIFLYRPARMGGNPEIFGIKEICKKFEIKRPEQIIDLLGLSGDAIDNIPGIPGIGMVTAKKLIAEFDNTENLIKNTAQLKGKIKENVEIYTEQALLSKYLATIVLDVPVEFDQEKFEVKKPDTEALKHFLEELELKALYKRIFKDSIKKDGKQIPIQSVPKQYQIDLFGNISNQDVDSSVQDESDKGTIGNTKHKYFLIDTKEKRTSLIEKLSQQRAFCFDTETTGLDTNKAELIGFSFAFIPKQAYFVSLPEDYNHAYQIVKEFKTVFENPDIEKTGQNMKFDISILKKYDIKVKGKFFDTMIAHYLIQPEMRHNMDFLAEVYLDYTPVSIESLIGKKGKNQLCMRTVPIDLLKEYACEDADITLQLKNVFEHKLDETNTRKLFNDIEMPLINVLASMQAQGVNIDTKILKDYSVQLEKEIKEVEKEIIDIAGMDFNISSPKQLGQVLFEHLKIVKNPKLTKTKQYSTGENILIKLVNKHPVIKKILDYRSLMKLKSTYVDALPEMINPKTGRIHTSYNQAVTATGRLSSNKPNLQNIPIRTERGKEIRKAFVPKNEHYTWLSADYSQIELRVIAEISKDKEMIKDFKNNLDIHSATGSKIFGVKYEDVTKEQRRKAKTVNFGIIYGISAFGLSQRLNIKRKEAAEIIEQYFIKYPAIKDYMNKTIEFARENGYVETIMGRRRYIRDINNNNAILKGYAERNAINAPIQGSAADIIKIAMNNIYKEINAKNLKSKMIIQVHDELNFDVLTEEIDIVKNIVKENMCNAIPMSFPLEIDMNTGKNWLQAH